MVSVGYAGTTFSFVFCVFISMISFNVFDLEGILMACGKGGKKGKGGKGGKGR